MERFNESGNRIEPGLCVRIAVECCEALLNAPSPRRPDARRVIRPETFALSRDGYVRLIPKHWGECDVGAGNHFGYMSPEEAKGVGRDERSDVFVVGIILWELLTGTGLFRAETDYRTVELVREAHVPPLMDKNPGVDAQLELIVGTAVAESPDERHQSLKELAADLTDYLTSRSLVTTPYDLRALL